jgi:hypothetical protein
MQNNAQFKAIDEYHRGKGWGGIGYHYLIEPDGKLCAGRAESTPGAHCKEQFMNYQSLGVALTGDFDREEPTPEQLKSLVELLQKLSASYDIKPEKILPHRKFATYKSCPGSRFSDKLIEELSQGRITELKIPAWAEAGVAWAREQGILNKITGEPVTDYRLAAILHNFFKKLS